MTSVAMIRRLFIRFSDWADFSSMGRGRVVLVTTLGTVFCIAAALIVDSVNFSGLSSEAVRRSIVIDIALPAFLAGPLLFYLMSKIRQLAIAHHEMSIIASHDGLTAILNRSAFTMLVDAYLDQARALTLPTEGALLVIDADDFKAINDQGGHVQGDRALKIIARTIESALRGADLVGRIGGEEFCVFLPRTSPAQAAVVAERIRQMIAEVNFPVTGSVSGLTVSIGGVMFNRGDTYDQLFAIADARLYSAKQAGKNRVEFGIA